MLTFIGSFLWANETKGNLWRNVCSVHSAHFNFFLAQCPFQTSYFSCCSYDHCKSSNCFIEILFFFLIIFIVLIFAIKQVLSAKWVANQVKSVDTHTLSICYFNWLKYGFSVELLVVIIYYRPFGLWFWSQCRSSAFELSFKRSDVVHLHYPHLFSLFWALNLNRTSVRDRPIGI